MRKLLAFTGAGVALLVGGTVTPVVPNDMTLLYSYQGPYLAQFIQDAPVQVSSSTPLQPAAPKEKRPIFSDDNGDGIISVSVFQGKDGKLKYVQIPETRYADMGKKDGVKQNPKETEFLTILEAVATPAKAAIAFDVASEAKDNSGSVSSITYSHTITGSNPILVVVSQAYSQTFSGATYNGTAMTLVSLARYSTSNVYGALWIMQAPPTGANNVVVTLNGTTAGNKQFAIHSMSYTGAAQTGQPDSFGTNTAEGSSVTTFTVTTTVVNSNTWLVGGASEEAGDIAAGSAGAGTTYRGAVQFNQWGADSNGTVATGARSLNWGRAGTGSANIEGIVVAICPVGGCAPPVPPAATPKSNVNWW